MTKGGEGTSGYKQTKEHTEKIRQANLGSKRTDEQKKNISEAHKGQKAWNKGISQVVKAFEEEVQCPFCLKTGRIGGMKRNHFDYCKENPNKLEKIYKKPSEKSEKNRKEKMKNLPKVQCPHCLKIISPQGKRWHFDRCKFKT